MSGKRLALRILEAGREVGVLLMAFGPLEAALNTNAKNAEWADNAGFLFFAIGSVLFAIAIYLEWRFLDAE